MWLYRYFEVSRVNRGGFLLFKKRRKQRKGLLFAMIFCKRKVGDNIAVSLHMHEECQRRRGTI